MLVSKAKTVGELVADLTRLLASGRIEADTPIVSYAEGLSTLRKAELHGVLTIDEVWLNKDNLPCGGEPMWEQVDIYHENAFRAVSFL